MISIRYKSATFFGLILAMTALFMLPSCSGSNDGTGNIPTIDFTDTSAVGDESILKVDAFCVPALTDSTMLNYPEPCGMSGNKIYLNSNDGTLVVFDITSGRCLSSFSHKGEGPEDYVTAWYAWHTVGGGDGWTVADVRSHKILSYTLGGEFISSVANDSINLITPSGRGWLGETRYDGNSHKRLYLYSSDWKPEAALSTPFVNRSMDQGQVFKETEFIISGEETLVLDSDTLYSISADNGLKPVMAFDCGNLKMPEFSSYEQYRKERDKYISYRISATGSHIMAVIWNNGMVTSRLIRRIDGHTLMSVTRPEAEGTLRIAHDGAEYPAIPQTVSDGRYFYAFIAGDDIGEAMGETESNPGYARLKIGD